jgi:hypothetical protein
MKIVSFELSALFINFLIEMSKASKEIEIRYNSNKIGLSFKFKEASAKVNRGGVLW